MLHPRANLRTRECSGTAVAGDTRVAAAVTSQNVPIYLRGVGTVIAYNTHVVRSQMTKLSVR